MSATERTRRRSRRPWPSSSAPGRWNATSWRCSARTPNRRECDPLDGPTEEGAAPVAPFSASAETAWALWVHHGLFTIPLRIDRWADDAGIERKKLQPLVRYASPDDLALDDDTLERIWLEHADAPGIGLLLARQGLVALDTDTPDADEWVRARKLDRTPTIRSRRGSKWILRGTAEQSASVLHPDVDVAISLVPLPPTPATSGSHRSASTTSVRPPCRRGSRPTASAGAARR